MIPYYLDITTTITAGTSGWVTLNTMGAALKGRVSDLAIVNQTGAVLVVTIQRVKDLGLSTELVTWSDTNTVSIGETATAEGTLLNLYPGNVLRAKVATSTGTALAVNQIISGSIYLFDAAVTG